MTFKDVVIKNFKGGYHKYLAYFLSSSFSIMLFFMYSTVILNKELKGRDDTEVLSYVFYITLVAIALFSVFFINYAHTAFMKGRNKEFGVYISLGINTKELRNLTNIESLLISTIALFTGVGVGSLFSRLFQMVILNMLEIKDIPFSLDYKPFLLTLGVFLFIFSTVMIRTMIRMKSMDISSLLREARRTEGRKYSKKDPIFGGLGFIIMVSSVFFLFIIAGNNDLNSNSIVLISYMATAFLGVYLALSYGGNLIIHMIKKSRFYYKNILATTELHHKFNQNKKIIFILSVVSTMTIFLVASPFALFSLSETLAGMEKNHLEYVETATVNKLSRETQDQILKGKNFKSYNTLKFIYLSTKEGSSKLQNSKPIVSQSEYNSLTGSNIQLEEGEAYNVVLDWIPGDHGIKPGSRLKLCAGDASYSFLCKASRKGDWIAGMASFTSDSIIIINDLEYKQLSAEITGSNIGYYHFINFKNWKNSRDTATALKVALGGGELKVLSIVDTYEELKSGYSVFLFVSTVMGIMFFVAGGSVLYFKQFTELGEAKITFKKLFKVGITDKEMQSIIGKELLIIFFLPLLFGTYLGFSLIYLMTFIVGDVAGADAIIKEFMLNASVVVIIYFVSQSVFYFITKNKYIIEITKG